MKSQRGQLAIYSALAAGAVFLIMGIALKVQSQRLESCKEEHQKFVSQVEANGKLAEQRKKEKEAQDEKRIQDAVSQRDVALKRLRDNRSASRSLSDNSIASAGNPTVCVPATVYNTAMARFGKDLSGFLEATGRYAERGDEAQIDAQALIQAWPLKMTTTLR